MPASKRPVSGEELHLLEALQEVKLSELRDPEPLKEALRYAMVAIGLREANWPADEEKALLIRFILNNYGGHTAEEIRLAFDLALAGRLEVDVTCYQDFTVAYFCRIMNAYREWATQTYQHLPQAEPAALPAPETTDEEFIQAVRAVYQLTRDWRAIPTLAYKVLEQQLNLSRTEKDRIVAICAEWGGAEAGSDPRSYAVAEYFDRTPPAAEPSDPPAAEC